MSKGIPHHLDRCFAEVSLSNESFLVSDIQAFLSQGLDDPIVTQERSSSITAQNQTASPTVKLSRQQQRHHRRLQVLLLILVFIERLLQLHWNTIYMQAEKRKQKVRHRHGE